MVLVLDTSVVVALLVADDADHHRCVALADGVDEDLVIPVPTLVEIDFWLRRVDAIDGWRIFVDQIASGGYRLHHSDEQQIVRAAELEQRYADLRLGFVDAAVIAACERLGETKVATLDHRHFSVVRPSHCDALTLLPA